VDSLKRSIDLMEDTFGLSLEYEEQIGQTRLAMLPVGQTYIELLESQGPGSNVTKWIGEKGPGLFHICFEVDDIDGALAWVLNRLSNRDVSAKVVVSQRPSTRRRRPGWTFTRMPGPCRTVER
jgi:catechol 2,3-dioxygenase-like lactoylglutathione lyase family enzyme